MLDDLLAGRSVGPTHLVLSCELVRRGSA
jgi:hypothetical protein